uniref:Uncharacterized protein n=1 Tax=Aegilops tauschii subsp. strangulata TaxID=200361 RepID=A0A453CJ59_AEGTS
MGAPPFLGRTMARRDENERYGTPPIRQGSSEVKIYSNGQGCLIGRNMGMRCGPQPGLGHVVGVLGSMAKSSSGVVSS